VKVGFFFEYAKVRSWGLPDSVTRLQYYGRIALLFLISLIEIASVELINVLAMITF